MAGYSQETERVEAGVKQRESGHFTIAMREQEEVLGMLEDRLDLLERRLEPVRYSEPRPADPSAASDNRMPMAPLALDISMHTSRILRIQDRINSLLAEIQV